MQARNPEMQRCIDACFQCHRTCLGMAMTHCLETGGKHGEPAHMRLMTSCADLCQTAGNAMLIDSPVAHQICAVCATVCHACADDCERVGDMDACVKACRDCAQACIEMSVGSQAGSGGAQVSRASNAGMQAM